MRNEKDDAISREAVRKILVKYCLGESKLAEELNELPPVTQKPEKWIPVRDEDLPKEGESVKQGIQKNMVGNGLMSLVQTIGESLQRLRHGCLYRNHMSHRKVRKGNNEITRLFWIQQSAGTYSRRTWV